MIKDLSEAIYYCSITKAMDEVKEEQMEIYHNEQPSMMYFRERKNGGNPSQGRNSSTNEGTNTHKEFEYYPNPYSGRSADRRRTYMESKHTNDKVANLRELEQYAQDLTSDIIEMIEGATLEEKQMLAKKLTILANKIQNNNT